MLFKVKKTSLKTVSVPEIPLTMMGLSTVVPTCLVKKVSVETPPGGIKLGLN